MRRSFASASPFGRRASSAETDRARVGDRCGWLPRFRDCRTTRRARRHREGFLTRRSSTIRGVGCRVAVRRPRRSRRGSKRGRGMRPGVSRRRESRCMGAVPRVLRHQCPRSAGIEAALAVSTPRRRRALNSTLPPPSFAATVISRMSLVKSAPLLASFTPFLRLIFDHLLWPATSPPGVLRAMLRRQKYGFQGVLINRRARTRGRSQRLQRLLVRRSVPIE